MLGARVPFLPNRRALLRSLAASGTCLLSGARAHAASVSLVLVTSPETRLENISLADLRQLFLGETVRDRADAKLVPLNQSPATPERVHFDQRVLGMSADEMARYWIDQKVRGLRGAPRNLSPPQMIARVVERFAGAVAYLRPEHVTGALRTVSIDGRAPGSAGYALAATGGKAT